jgi:hypothetical protein
MIVLLVSSAVLFILGLRVLLPGIFPLSTIGQNCSSLTSPAAQIIFNPCGTNLSCKYNALGGATQTSYVTGPALTNGSGCFTASSSWSDTSVFWPIGVSGTSFDARYCDLLGCSPTEYWDANLPGSSGSYGANFATSGPQLLTTSSPDCVTNSGDCITYPAGNSTAPPSICPGGGCYEIPNTYTAYKTNSTGTYSATVNAAYYVYRFVFSLTININVASSSIQVECSPAENPNNCPETQLCAPGEIPNLTCGQPESYFLGQLSNWISSVNTASILTNSKISLQINTPLNAIQSNLDWYGIYGAWSSTSDSSGCTSGSSCSTGLGVHTPLGIYQDPLMTLGAYPTNTTQFSSFLQDYSIQQLQNILPSHLYNTVYISIPLTNFGATFAVSQACTINTMAACFNASNSISYTLPVIYDVMGSKTPFFGSLDWVSTTVTCTCQSVYGRVLDGNSPFSVFGFYNPLPGAAVCVTACATTVAQNQQTTTNSTGFWFLYNIPLTSGGVQTVSVYVQAIGYNPQQIQPLVSPSGPPVNAGSIVLQPTSANSYCIIPAIPNPVPGAPPVFGGFCLDKGLTILLILITAGIIGFTVFLVVPSRRKATISTKKGGFSI